MVNTDETTNIYIRAVDEAGNKGSWSEQKIVKRDTVAPTVTLTGTANGSTDVKLTGTGTDANCNIYYGWSANKSTQPSSWTTANAKTTTIDNTVTSTQCFWIKDEAGNTACKLATLSKHTHSTSCQGTCKATLVQYGTGGACETCGRPVQLYRCGNGHTGQGCIPCQGGVSHAGEVCGKKMNCSQSTNYTCSIS